MNWMVKLWLFSFILLLLINYSDAISSKTGFYEGLKSYRRLFKNLKMTRVTSHDNWETKHSGSTEIDPSQFKNATGYYIKFLQTLPLDVFTFDVCVIARTYIQQSFAWNAFTASIAAAAVTANQTVKIVFVDTDLNEPRSLQGQYQLAEFVSKYQAYFGTKNVVLSVSSRTNRSPETVKYRARFGFGTNDQDYGYLITDLELDALLVNPNEQCDYVLISNADNLYHQNLFTATTEARKRARIDVIGMFMVSHYSWGPPSAEFTNERAGPDVLLRSEIRPGGIDLGAMLFSRKTFIEYPQLRFARPRPALTIPVEKIYLGADGDLALQTSFYPDLKRTVIERILFFHQ